MIWNLILQRQYQRTNLPSTEQANTTATNPQTIQPTDRIQNSALMPTDGAEPIRKAKTCRVVVPAMSEQKKSRTGMLSMSAEMHGLNLRQVGLWCRRVGKPRTGRNTADLPTGRFCVSHPCPNSGLENLLPPKQKSRRNECRFLRLLVRTKLHSNGLEPLTFGSEVP